MKKDEREKTNISHYILISFEEVVKQYSQER